MGDRRRIDGDGSVRVPGLAEVAEVFRSELAAAEPTRCSGAECAEIAEQLARTEKACAAARAAFSARASAFGEHRTRGFAEAHEWVARTAGASIGEAKAELATVAALDALPETRAAVVAGDVSLVQAAEVARVPGCERELLAVARTQSLGALKARATRRHLESFTREELGDRQHRARSVRHWRDELGMRRIDMALTPEFGTRWAQRLDRETDRVWREAYRDGRLLTHAQAAADAFERIIAGTASTGAERTDLVFVCDLPAWERGHLHAGEVCHVVGGGPVSLAAIRRQVSDAFVKVVLHDGVKVDTIVHYGRRRPAALQSVLDLGPVPDFDGVTCVEDDCDRRFGLEWDHVDPVANDGMTSAENLVPRCKPHHREKTERDRAEGKLGARRERAP
jgi:hypothetical protein